MKKTKSEPDLLFAKRCDRDAFIAASEGLLLENRRGRVRMGEPGIPFVQAAEKGEIVILTIGGVPVSYIQNKKEIALTETGQEEKPTKKRKR